MKGGTKMAEIVRMEVGWPLSATLQLLLKEELAPEHYPELKVLLGTSVGSPQYPLAWIVRIGRDGVKRWVWGQDNVPEAQIAKILASRDKEFHLRILDPSERAGKISIGETWWDEGLSTRIWVEDSRLLAYCMAQPRGFGPWIATIPVRRPKSKKDMLFDNTDVKSAYGWCHFPWRACERPFHPVVVYYGHWEKERLLRELQPSQEALDLIHQMGQVNEFPRPFKRRE